MNDKTVFVIGANYGDEGKGLMVDYFADRYGSENENKTAVLRYNSGSQAGHTVVTPSGKRHVFSHIGAGAFTGADTYLLKNFITNPMIFAKEYREFKNVLIDSNNLFKSQTFKMPNIYISENCNITLPYDMLLNQYMEKERGDARHGSCGLGLWESRFRYIKGYNFSYKDILKYYKNNDKQSIKDKIKKIRDKYYLKHMLEEYGLSKVGIWFIDIFNSENVIDNFIEDLFFTMKTCKIESDEALGVNLTYPDEYSNYIYESAQGLLLSSDLHSADYKHTTICHTGFPDIIDFMDLVAHRKIEVCYVTRPYLTRHGDGPFKETDLPSWNIKILNIHDNTNVENEFQGKLRYGLIDLDEFKTRIVKDIKDARNKNITLSIAITHLDETEENFITTRGVRSHREVIKELEEFFKKELSNVIDVKFYTSTGPERTCVKEILDLK